MTTPHAELQTLTQELGQLESVRRKKVLWKLVFLRQLFKAPENELWNSLSSGSQRIYLLLVGVISIVIPIGILFYMILSSISTPRPLFNIIAIFVVVFIALAAASGAIMRKAIDPELNQRLSETRTRMAELQNQISG